MLSPQQADSISTELLQAARSHTQEKLPPSATWEMRYYGIPELKALPPSECMRHIRAAKREVLFSDVAHRYFVLVQLILICGIAFAPYAEHLGWLGAIAAFWLATINMCWHRFRVRTLVRRQLRD